MSLWVGHLSHFLFCWITIWTSSVLSSLQFPKPTLLFYTSLIFFVPYSLLRVSLLSIFAWQKDPSKPRSSIGFHHSPISSSHQSPSKLELTFHAHFHILKITCIVHICFQGSLSSSRRLDKSSRAESMSSLNLVFPYSFQTQIGAWYMCNSIEISEGERVTRLLSSCHCPVTRVLFGWWSRVFSLLSSTPSAEGRPRAHELHLEARLQKPFLTWGKEQQRKPFHWGWQTQFLHKCSWACLLVLGYDCLEICNGQEIRCQMLQAKSHRSNISKMAY